MQKTVLITGAAKRIGAYVAGCLHEAGMDVVIHYNSSRVESGTLEKRLNDTRPESAISVHANLADNDSLHSLCDAALKFKGRIDVLINNASVFLPTPVHTASSPVWEDIMNVNVKAPFFLSQLLAKPQTGLETIINIADIHAERPLRGYSMYSISQAGIIMLTKSLARELAPDIRVNAISPGAISWPSNTSEDEMQAILSRISLKRAGTNKDIANAALFLIEGADYMTGQVLTIDGGRTLYS